MDSPPYYILISNQNQSSSSSTALTHPVIQYHYADDSPIALLPRFPEERVIVLDADSSSSAPTVRSLSQDIVATDLRTVEASGAAVDDGGPPRDDRMYIIETTAKDEK
ncbi:hypothetical protein ONZ45_g2333 [Pleurotus djamor]|nr:hypothetical protein ONZ45_g2333 [Pleurotus djamor]